MATAPESWRTFFTAHLLFVLDSFFLSSLKGCGLMCNIMFQNVGTIIGPNGGQHKVVIGRIEFSLKKKY